MMKRHFRLDGYLYQEEGDYLGDLSEGAEEVAEADYLAYLAGIEVEREAQDEMERIKGEERRNKRKATAERIAKRFQLEPDEMELLFGVL